MKTQDRDGMKGLKQYEQQILVFVIFFLLGYCSGDKIGHALGWW